VLPADLVSLTVRYKMSADLGTSIMDQIAFGQLNSRCTSRSDT
jgi:hypothetical protein